MIAQNPPRRQRVYLARTRLLDSLEEYIRALRDLINTQSQIVTVDGLLETGGDIEVPATYNDSNYFIVQVEFDNQSIGFVIRRQNLYVDGFIRNYNPDRRTGTYYYVRNERNTTPDNRVVSPEDMAGEVSNSIELGYGGRYGDFLRTTIAGVGKLKFLVWKI